LRWGVPPFISRLAIAVAAIAGVVLIAIIRTVSNGPVRSPFSLNKPDGA
jgi:hypothetical protein